MYLITKSKYARIGDYVNYFFGKIDRSRRNMKIY